MSVLLWRTERASQVVRCLWEVARRKLRPRLHYPEVAAYAEALDRDGAVVIPDFYPPEVFQELRREFEATLRPDAYPDYSRKVSGNLVLESINLSKHADDLPGFRRNVEQDHRIYKIVASRLGRRFKYTAPVYTEVLYAEDPTQPISDIQNVLHADVHYPTIKLWLYLNDVTEDNGALRYAMGSHRMTSARLRHEYELSIRSAYYDSGRLDRLDPRYLQHGRPAAKPENLAKMGVDDQPIRVRANTLVIADTCGFHKRGNFAPTGRREAVTMSFRYVESLHHRIYPRFGATPRPGGEYVPSPIPPH